jgi:hypothetical protein
MVCAMSRIGVLVLLAAVGACAACSKSAATSDPGGTAPPPNGATAANPPAGQGTPAAAGSGAVGSGASGPIDPQLRLHAEEGTLAVVPPTDSKAGAEVVAKITLTPTAAYHVNMDFPIKLQLDAPQNVTLAKTELKAGGPAKQGDAEALDERQLVFAVKLTPTQSGNYTINGSFKFAVCTDTQCLPKKEPIAIQIAAK